jgi:adenine phosphoribosyltransferase
MTIEEKIKSLLRDVPDFPRPGILFKDITPLLGNPQARDEVVEYLIEQIRPLCPDSIAGIEARGFIFGMLLAQALKIPFIPIRKAGKLPYKKISQEYDLEYGTAEIEMHEDAFKPGTRVIIHDDLLATGGTASAAGQLVKRLGGIVAGYSFLINLSFLPGESKLIEEFDVKPHYLVSF